MVLVLVLVLDMTLPMIMIIIMTVSITMMRYDVIMMMPSAPRPSRLLPGRRTRGDVMMMMMMDRRTGMYVCGM